MSRRALAAAAAAAGMGILVGASMVASRYAIGQTTPALLAFLRYAIGFLCLLPIAWMIGGKGFAARDWLPIGLLGIVQFGVLVALLNFALLYISAGRAALIFGAVPLLTLAAAAAIGRERLNLPKLAGVLISMAGIAIVVGDGLRGLDDAAAGWIGDLASLGAAVCATACSLLYRPYLAKYPTLSVSAFAMLASVAFLGAWAMAEGSFGLVPDISGTAWGAIAFIGTGSAVGYCLWLWALNNASPTRVTVFMGLGPVTAAILGNLLLSEAITLPHLAALALVVCGIWLSHRD